MDVNEKILIYWSGEADEALSREVEALLDSDESARAYLAEMNDFSATLRESEPPAQRPGLIDEVLESHDRERKIIVFPKPALLAVASLALMAAVLSLVLRPSADLVMPIMVNPVITTPEPEETKLSERLLSSTDSFQRGSERLRKSFRQRSRWEKL